MISNSAKKLVLECFYRVWQKITCQILKGLKKRFVFDFSINMSPLVISSQNRLKIEPHSGEMFIEKEFHILANPFRGGMLSDTTKCPLTRAGYLISIIQRQIHQQPVIILILPLNTVQIVGLDKLVIRV